MKPSRQIRPQRRLAIFNFFVLGILIFASTLSAQDWGFKIEQGREATTNLLLNNSCPHTHLFRIDNTIRYLRFTESTSSILVGSRSSKSLGMRFNTAGLAPQAYSDQLLVKCIDCKDTCNQHNIIKNIRMTVFKSEISPTPKITQTTPSPTPTTPTPTPSPTSTIPTTPTPLLEETSKLTETPTPTPTPAELLTDAPTETAPLMMSPDETPPAETAPPSIAEVAQNPSPPEPAFVKYLKYPVLISALVFVLSLSTLGGKNFLDKRKYGNNALQNLSSLKKAIHVKEQLSQKWMKRRKTQNLHAIGVGKTGAAGGYCIQLFVENANGEMPENPPIHLLPGKYRQFPIVIYEMPRAEFLAGNENHGCQTKECHDTIIGGISGANTNLANEYGTIGYFCAPTILRPIRKFRKEVYLLSNSHVFADLNKPKKDDNDLIQQPSPGENKRHNFVASLENYVPLLFDNDTENPNYIDAAIARLFQGKEHRLEIPVIGKINNFVPKEKVEINQECRKFGRTTGYTEGEVFSIHLSIWIRYAATGQESFFKEQFLIIPTGSHNDFVKGGDSGSLVADGADNAIGLVFAGANSDRKFNLKDLPDVAPESLLAAVSTEKIRSFGVANPISEVLKGLNVKLML